MKINLLRSKKLIPTIFQYTNKTLKLQYLYDNLILYLPKPLSKYATSRRMEIEIYLFI